MKFECDRDYNSSTERFICIPEDEPPISITRNRLVSMLEEWHRTKDLGGY